MAQASKRIINIEGAERKIKQAHESALIAAKAIDHLVSVVTEATKAIQEFQKVADNLVLEDIEDGCAKGGEHEER